MKEDQMRDMLQGVREGVVLQDLLVEESVGFDPLSPMPLSPIAMRLMDADGDGDVSREEMRAGFAAGMSAGGPMSPAIFGQSLS